jgi:hypothetical protein
MDITFLANFKSLDRIGTTTEIILHSSASSIHELGKTKNNFLKKNRIIHLQIIKI